MITMKIIWQSAEAKMTGDKFLQERRDMVESFIEANKIILPIYNPPDNTAIVSFSSLDAAEEYKALLQTLADKYNKGLLVFNYEQ